MYEPKTDKNMDLKHENVMNYDQSFNQFIAND